MAGVSDPLLDFAYRYTAAWCSQDPGKVASHYSPSGSLSINNGSPAVGRAAICEVAKSFMTAFPDLRVIMDRLIPQGQLTEYHWTLLGTNTGPGGTGRHVRVSGFEIWKLDGSGLIADSRGHFDAELYRRQLEYGVEGIA